MDMGTAKKDGMSGDSKFLDSPFGTAAGVDLSWLMGYLAEI